MANYMAEVAAILGIELGERFKINFENTLVPDKCIDNDYYLTEDGVKFDKEGHSCISSDVLSNLLCGVWTIRKNPWKPRDFSEYWYIDEFGLSWRSEWHNTCLSDHMNYYKIGNCYKTQEEAEKDSEKWKAFYASDEMLEV